MRRRWRLGLRTRTTAAFALSGLLLSLALSVLTYQLARQSFTRQRREAAVSRALQRARSAQASLQVLGVDPVDVVDQLKPGANESFVIEVDGTPFASGPEDDRVEDAARRAFVLEATGVAHQCRIEAERNLAAQRETEPINERSHHDPTGRGLRVDHVDRAVALIRNVMVDHDEFLGGLCQRTQIAEPPQRPTIEGDHHAEVLGHLRRASDEVQAGQIAVVRRDHERVGKRGDTRPTRREESV